MTTLERYRILFPESAINDSTLEQRFAEGFVWNHEGALLPPTRSADTPELQASGLRATLGELFVQQLGRNLENGKESVSMGNLIADGISFDIRHEEETERFELVSWGGETHKIPRLLGGFGELDSTHGEQLEIDPMTGEELVELLTHFYGENIFVRMNEQAVHNSGHHGDSVEWRYEMDRQTRVELSYLLEDIENVIEIEKEEEAAARAQLLAKARTQEERAAARKAHCFWRLTMLWSLTPEQKRRREYLARTGDALPKTEDVALRMEAEAQDLVRKLRRSLEGDFFCPPWNYEDRWSLGHSDGLCEDRAAQNDAAMKPLEPFSELDGDLLEVLKVTEAPAGSYESMACYDQAFYRGGEALGVDENNNEIFATAGDSRPWAERNLYLWRQAHERVERVRTMLWRICTYPIEWVEQQLAGENNPIRRKYIASVKDNKAGPGKSQKVGDLRALANNGDVGAARVLADVTRLGWLEPGKNYGWVNTPLYGMAAANWIKEHVSLELRRGRRINLQKVCVTRFPTWHKLWLTSEQLQQLTDAINWRLGKRAAQAAQVMQIKLVIAQTLILARQTIMGGNERALTFQVVLFLRRALRELKYHAQPVAGTNPEFYAHTTYKPLSERSTELAQYEAETTHRQEVYKGALDCVQGFGAKKFQTLGEKLPAEERFAKRSAAAKKGWATRRKNAERRATSVER